MKTQRRSSDGPAGQPLRGCARGFAVLVYLPVYSRNLDVDSGVSFPCLCTVNFLIANISMISLAPWRTASKRRQKNRSRNLSYCEPKSDAKLQPLFILTKHLEEKKLKITHVNVSMGNLVHFLTYELLVAKTR